MAIVDWPEAERPREKLLQKGPQALSDAELLAIFLRTGVQGRSAVEMGRELIARFGSVAGLMQASWQEASVVKGFGPAKFVQLQAVMELGRRALETGLREGNVLTSPAATRQFLKARLAHYPNEVFACLMLDSQHRLLQVAELFYGTIDAASVYPREVVRKVIEHNAAAVIFAHNHPSGVAEPSQADEAITRRLVEALQLIDVRVLDHFVIGHGEPVSFAERGLL